MKTSFLNAICLKQQNYHDLSYEPDFKKLINSFNSCFSFTYEFNSVNLSFTKKNTLYFSFIVDLFTERLSVLHNINSIFDRDKTKIIIKNKYDRFSKIRLSKLISVNNSRDHYYLGDDKLFSLLNKKQFENLYLDYTKFLEEYYSFKQCLSNSVSDSSIQDSLTNDILSKIENDEHKAIFKKILTNNKNKNYLNKIIHFINDKDISTMNVYTSFIKNNCFILISFPDDSESFIID